ncbi:MAG: hypothetical protein AVDCRST_MAG54-1148, partial [uncultured Actinomycetospora sp.]
GDHPRVRLALPGDREPVQRPPPHRRRPGHRDPSDGAAALRLAVDRRPLLRLRPEDRPLPRGVDDADVARGAPRGRRAGRPRARRRLPPPAAAGEDGGDTAVPQRRALRAGHRRRVARARVPRLRLRLPAPGGALRAARGSDHDLPADVDRGRPVVRGAALPHRRRRGPAAARPAAARLHRRRGRACRAADGRAARGHVERPVQGGGGGLRPAPRHRAPYRRGRRPGPGRDRGLGDAGARPPRDRRGLLAARGGARGEGRGRRRPLRHGLRQPGVHGTGAALRRAGHGAAAHV